MKKASLKFIDLMEKKNIKESPLLKLEERFHLQEESLSSHLEYLPTLSTPDEKVYGFSTSAPVLHYQNYQLQKKPKEIEVFHKNKPLPYFDEAQGDKIRWQFIKISKKIPLEEDKSFSRHLRCLILEESEYFSFDTFLPSTPFSLEIVARRNRIPSELEIYLDEKLISKESLQIKKRKITLENSTSSGFHKISLKTRGGEDGEERKELKGKNVSRIFIFGIWIKAKNDYLLLHLPSSSQEDFEEKELKTRYLSSQDESREENPYSQLYRIKQEFTLSPSEQARNPENIKKKIILEDTSLDALIAPPRSEFEFVVKIPQGAYLEFGTGIFRYDNQPLEINDSVLFKVLISEGKKITNLFEIRMPQNTKKKRETIHLEKIDLEEYAGKKVKISFITEGNRNSLSKNAIYSFWYNPVLYRKVRESPKVILISLDTLRADHLGCYGYKRETSPNLDLLSKESVLLENVYAQSPWTLPSHVSLLYSLNSINHKVYYHDQRIDPSLPSLSFLLRKGGFFPVAFTGGGYVSNLYGFAKGFHWYEEPRGGRYAPLSIREAEKLQHIASGWIKENRDKPFFLFLHTFQIHDPYDCPSPWITYFASEKAKWKRMAMRNFLESNPEGYSFSEEEVKNVVDLYDAEIRYTDEALIGPLINLLKKLEIYNDTLLIITSDHGEEFLDHGGWLHGQKLYEEQIRVPLLMKFPKGEFKGIRIKEKCRLIDVMPTILEYYSLNYPKKSLDGKSLLDLIRGKEKKDRTFISDLARKDVPDPCPALIATNEGEMKLIVEMAKEGIKNIEVFDLKKDPQEKNNLITKFYEWGNDKIERLENYYQAKKKIKRQTERIKLDERLKEKLRALGYIH